MTVVVFCLMFAGVTFLMCMVDLLLLNAVCFLVWALSVS